MGVSPIFPADNEIFMTTAKQRKAYRRSLPEVELAPKHTALCRVLPDRNHLLEVMEKQAVIAEIGVGFGAFSKEIAARCAPQHLYLIDAWAEERYSDGRGKVEAYLSDELDAGLVSLHQGFSTDVLLTFDDGFFDWVYIDTKHSFEVTREELAIARQKVRTGGRISGHDFCMGNVVAPIPYGVIQACNQFCVECDWGYEYLTLESNGYFSFCLKALD